MKLVSLKYKELILTVDPKTFTVEGGYRVTKGMNGQFPRGLSLSFKGGEFDTKSLNLSFGEEQKLVKALKGHPSLGVSFRFATQEVEDEAAANANESEVKGAKKAAAAAAAETDHSK